MLGRISGRGGIVIPVVVGRAATESVKKWCPFSNVVEFTLDEDSLRNLLDDVPAGTRGKVRGKGTDLAGQEISPLHCARLPVMLTPHVAGDAGG